MRRLLLVLLFLAGAACGDTVYRMEQIQGSWWSDPDAPTADLAISGKQIWLDFDSAYHPAWIAGGDTLTYDLGEGMGTIRHRIVSLEGDVLVLERVRPGETTTTTYHRKGPGALDPEDDPSVEQQPVRRLLAP